MKRITQLLILAMLMILPLSLTSCSDKDGDDNFGNGSIVGKWQQINDSGTKIEITFKSGGKGQVYYSYTSGSEYTEHFEYTLKVDSDNDMYVYITSDDCQLTGRHEVIITPNTLSLIGSINGKYGTYQFKRV